MGSFRPGVKKKKYILYTGNGGIWHELMLNFVVNSAGLVQITSGAVIPMELFLPMCSVMVTLMK